MRHIVLRIIEYIMVAVMVLTLFGTPVFADEVMMDTEETVIVDILTSDETISDPAYGSDNDDLFMHYVENRLEQSEIDKGEAKSVLKRRMPSGINGAIYNSLKRQIKQVADGASDSAEFNVTLEDLCLDKDSWTAAELGVSAIVENGSVTAEAKKALTNKLGIDMRSVITALLFDCPYDLYWYDKEKGISIQGPGISAERVGNDWTLRISSGLVLYFTVAEDYSAGDAYEVDTSRAERVNHAVDKASSIVKEYKGATDHDKIYGYKEEICSLVAYDNDAASDYSRPYGDSWQVISVFDEDETTNVVCEGYAKAFQYLCNLTEFEGNVSCISVGGYISGYMGSADHMWNIVNMGDGRNFLADLTNCDTDTMGEPDQLFMAGYTSGDVDSGYTFSYIGGEVSYSYDQDTLNTFDDELIIAPKGSDTDPFHEEESDITVDSVYRLYGSTRYETSIEVADDLKAKLKLDKFSTVILADGRNYPDALAGSYLSCLKSAPILLVDDRQDRINAVQKYITDNMYPGGTIYMLGGSAVVPDAAVTGLTGYKVKRLWGDDRYATNLAILKEAGVTEDEIIVTSGNSYADSLSAAALGKPVLLVKQSLNDSQKRYLASFKGSKGFVIIGGTGAVNDDISKELSSYGPVDRVGGSTRYETSVGVAGRFFKKPKTAVLAFGEDFPDGLCGGTLANAMGGPLILATSGKFSQAEDYAKGNGINAGAVLGGPTLINETVVKRIFQIN